MRPGASRSWHGPSPIGTANPIGLSPSDPAPIPGRRRRSAAANGRAYGGTGKSDALAAPCRD
eukprot:764527-Hanusia_phi.AAC.7